MKPPGRARVTLRSPLHELHAELGATFTEFAGYDMPVHYGSIKQEHMGVREAAGLFDVSHMSNLRLSGPGAASAIGRVCPFDAAGLAENRGRYTAVLREDGSIVDDAYCYRLGPQSFLLIPNAGQNELVAHHIRANAPDPDGLEIEDTTASDGILALQGPASEAVLEAAGAPGIPKRNHAEMRKIAGVDVMVAGTGYTGERGVELFLPADGAGAVWRHLLAEGKQHGLVPVGLGARDTLRLEKGFCLAGNEFEGRRTPVEAGLGWFVQWDHDFLGKQALVAQKESGDHDRLMGILQDKGIPRHGCAVLKDGEQVGVVTSGSMSPVLGKGIALAYVRGAALGDDVAIEVRGRPHAARIVRTPFL